MPFIRTTVPFNEAARGRVLRGLVRPNGRDDLLLAETDDVRPGDEVLDPDTFHAQRQAIIDANGVAPEFPLPLPDPVLEQILDLLDQPDPNLSTADLKALTLLALRWLFRDPLAVRRDQTP